MSNNRQSELVLETGTEPVRVTVSFSCDHTSKGFVKQGVIQLLLECPDCAGGQPAPSRPAMTDALVILDALEILESVLSDKDGASANAREWLERMKLEYLGNGEAA